MSPWIVLLIWVASVSVWFFCGVRVREAMRRRCEDRSIGCPEEWGDVSDSHTFGRFFGFVFGPFMLISVYVYELADGTTRCRFRAWRENRKVRKAKEAHEDGTCGL